MKFFLFFIFLSKLSSASSFVLITTLYNERDPVRIDEYFECLTYNINNLAIEKIVVLFEDNIGLIENKKLLKKRITDISSSKLEVRYVSARPSFNEIFSLANLEFSNHKIIYANADIYFDNSLTLLKDEYLNNRLVCLSRYDFIDNKWQSYSNGFLVRNKRYKASFDSWIFLAPINIQVPDFFKPGLWGCEKFINHALDTGIRLSNPSKDIKSYHVHGSCVRHYNNKDKFGMYKFIYLPENCLVEKNEYIKTSKEINGRFLIKLRLHAFEID